MIGKLIPAVTKIGKVAVKGAKIAAKSKLGRELKDQALNAVGNSAVDLLAGKSPTETLQNSLEQAKETISDTIKESLQKQKPKPAKKRGRSGSLQKGKKKFKNFDLFHQ